MAPAPKTKSAELIAQFGRYSFKNPIDNFSLEKFKREAKGLLNSEPEQYWNARGALACLEKNLPEMHRCHQNAIEISGHSADLIGNFAISLRRVGLRKEAYIRAFEAHQARVADPQWLSVTIEYATYLGRFDLAKKHLEAWGKLFPDKIHFLEKVVDAAIAKLNKYRVDIQVFSEVVCALIDHLNANAFCGWESGELVAPEDNDPMTFVFDVFGEGVDTGALEYDFDDIIQAYGIPEEFLEDFSIEIFDQKLVEFLNTIDQSIEESGETISAPTQDELALIDDLIAGVELD